ncbi:MAG TPA: alcohol dehydrogenase catalytic domain-containing protein [Blastocatellia bacterium]|nr:alcohol dehydrogenase catalytic domain-containing protein [Blastocatellia bacterium]
MKALRFDDGLKLVHDADVPRREGEALVQVICAGICNTDLEIVRGYGGFRGTLGHEFVGRVVESPGESIVGQRVVGEINAGCGECILCTKGDPRHCATRTVLGIKGRDGAFAEYLSLPVHNLVNVPDSLNDEAAVFAEPLAAAFNILEQIDILPSSRVVIVGDGKLAQLIVLVMTQTGCDLAVVGKHEKKLVLAQTLGAKSVLADSPSLGSKYLGSFDVAIEASGSPVGLGTALKLVRPRGTVVLKSTHHDSTPLDTSAIVVNELRLIGSRCGRLRQAIDFLTSSRLDPGQLISERLPLDRALLAFEKAADPNTMKVILHIS